MQNAETKFIEKALSAVGDPYRLSILNAIAENGFIRCCDVVDLTGLSQPTCSHHIKLLADSNLIESRKEGRHNIFTLNKPNFKKIGIFFEQLTSA
ncbi:MAG: winged helix-turn-helix transcriptional regulator [Chitinophagaceae bacterium]|nr:winged helix-turn-helix transcriptional regulator [Chitinophagaceae bacterium]